MSHLAISRIGIIKQTLVKALSALASVRRIDSFGSVAAGVADRWSDLDLLVTCGDIQRTAWVAADTVRATFPVALYAPFTNVEQPSGRYWFRDESPFHRLDVTFICEDARAAIEVSNTRRGHPVTTRREYAQPRRRNLIVAAPPIVASPVADSPAAAALGKRLYRYLETLKDEARGLSTAATSAEALSNLLTALAVMDREDRRDIVSFVTFVVESADDLCG